MRIKNNLILRQIGNTWAVFPISDALTDYGNIMKLNETGAFMWNMLKDGCTREELVHALIKEYSIDSDKAEASADSFLTLLDTYHILIHS